MSVSFFAVWGDSGSFVQVPWLAIFTNRVIFWDIHIIFLIYCCLVDIVVETVVLIFDHLHLIGHWTPVCGCGTLFYACFCLGLFDLNWCTRWCFAHIQVTSRRLSHKCFSNHVFEIVDSGGLWLRKWLGWYFTGEHDVQVIVIRLIKSFCTFIAADFSLAWWLVLWLDSWVNTFMLNLIFTTLLPLFWSGGTSFELIKFSITVCILWFHSRHQMLLRYW